MFTEYLINVTHETYIGNILRYSVNTIFFIENYDKYTSYVM